jgi:hypothetical protein
LGAIVEASDRIQIVQGLAQCDPTRTSLDHHLQKASAGVYHLLLDQLGGSLIVAIKVDRLNLCQVEEQGVDILVTKWACVRWFFQQGSGANRSAAKSDTK